MNLEKLRYQLTEALKLNQWFGDQCYPEMQVALDTICTYLAVAMNHKDFSLDEIDRIPEVVKQIEKAIQGLKERMEKEKS